MCTVHRADRRPRCQAVAVQVARRVRSRVFSAFLATQATSGHSGSETSQDCPEVIGTAIWRRPGAFVAADKRRCPLKVQVPAPGFVLDPFLVPRYRAGDQGPHLRATLVGHLSVPRCSSYRVCCCSGYRVCCWPTRRPIRPSGGDTRPAALPQIDCAPPRATCI